MDQDELQARFQGQGRARIANERSGKARNARRSGMIASALPLLSGVSVLVLILKSGVAVGPWLAPCVLGILMCVPAWFLAKLGRTRWSFAAFLLGVLLVQVADAISHRSVT